MAQVNSYPRLDYITRWNLIANEEKKKNVEHWIDNFPFFSLGNNNPWIIDFIDFLCSKAMLRNHKVSFFVGFI